MCIVVYRGAIGVEAGFKDGGEMCVVRDVFHAESQAGMGAVEGEFAFDARMCFLAELVVPPMTLAVEVVEVECRCDVLKESAGLQAYRVLAEAEVQVGIARD